MTVYVSVKPSETGPVIDEIPLPVAPVAPLITSNVVDVPFVKLIVYVSVKPSETGPVIEAIPLPVAPVAPFVTVNVELAPLV